MSSVAEKPRAASSAGRSAAFDYGSLALNIAGVIAGIAIWWALTASGAVGLPRPPDVLSRFIELAGNGQLLRDTAASLARVLAGFLLGVLLAIPVGFAMGWYKVARALVEPYLQFFRMIPPLAIIPLAIVTMGIEETPKIFVIFLASFLASVVATYQGVISVDRPALPG
jgi:NitT/TauT family transport system permease protein